MSLKIAGFDVAVGSVIKPGDEASGPYDPLRPSTQTLPKGHRRRDNTLAFPEDTIFEKDVVLPMRDGKKLYADIFRPPTKDKIPAILIWSPYGKTGNGPHGLDMIPGRFGVAQEQLSGYEKFEGLDPPVWAAKGFAIVNVDLRGTWDSEGIVPWLGEQDGKDGYDAIEHIATLDWCSGKIALAGNSWLAMSQWFIAAQQPPHLVAIAPWEGATDFYRDTLARGGIPYPYDLFWSFIEGTKVGREGKESITTMLKKYPLYNEYWEDKRAKLDQIKVPAYILASYSSSLHTSGSIRAFNELGSREKWLRIHSKQEWSDLYAPENVDDLQKFFDYYLKGVKNDWTHTPTVRVSLLRYNKPSLINIPFQSYPVAQTKYTKFFLSENQTLTPSPAKQSSSSSYSVEHAPKEVDSGTEELVFRHQFSKPIWLVGYSYLVIYISNDSHDDVDVFMQLRKQDASGNTLQYLNVPLQNLVPPAKDTTEVSNSCFLKYLGPTGALRGSHAGTKVAPRPDDVTGGWPEYQNDSQKLIPPGTIVRLEVPIWPGGMTFDAGEYLVVKVAGHYLSMMEFESLNGASHCNKGRHTVYFGGQYDSHLVVPLVEPTSSV